MTKRVKTMQCYIPNLEAPRKTLASNNDDAPNTTKYGSLLRHSMNIVHNTPFAPLDHFYN